MDFGIAGMASGASGDNLRSGTPRYMAPEYIRRGEVSPQADVFALGAILFEMLTGNKAFDAASREALLEAVCEAPVPAPSTLNPEVGQRLDAVVLKALEKEPTARYGSAGEMLVALLEYRELSDGAGGSGRAEKGTVEFLIRRMQHSSDFPVLSESIRTLNRLAASEQEDMSRMASVIIRDFALTNKILKVVNSAYYSRFSGKIGTVSRAIVVLGIKPIRSIAATLIFFEHLHDKAQASRLKDEIAAAIFSATLARQAAEDAGMAEVEESFLAGMLHNLGRILVAYYLEDESEEINRLVRQEGQEPRQAQMAVIGMPFEEVGIAIAKQWNFPAEITSGMQRVDPASPGDLNDSAVKLRLIASFSSEAAIMIGDTDPDERQPFQRLLRRYRMSLAISDKRFNQMVSEARQEFHELGGSLASGSAASGFLRRLATDQTNTSTAKPEQSATSPGGVVELDGAGSPGVPSADLSAEAILTEGLQEVTGMLLDESVSLSQVFNVVLETVYRALAFQRVVLCLQDVKRGQYVARLGFGEGIEPFMAQFHFATRYSPNVFHAALKNGVDLYIADTRDKKIRDDIPSWYKKLSPAGSFILFPLVVKSRPLGLIYADHNEAQGVTLNGGELNLIKALRNQVILAFHARAD